MSERSLIERLLEAHAKSLHNINEEIMLTSLKLTKLIHERQEEELCIKALLLREEHVKKLICKS